MPPGTPRKVCSHPVSTYFWARNPFRKLLDYFSDVVSGEGGGGILLHGPPKTGKQAAILYEHLSSFGDNLVFPHLSQGMH